MSIKNYMLNGKIIDSYIFKVNNTTITKENQDKIIEAYKNNQNIEFVEGNNKFNITFTLDKKIKKDNLLVAYLSDSSFWEEKLKELELLENPTHDKLFEFMEKHNRRMEDIETSKKDFKYYMLYAYILEKIYKNDLLEYIKSLGLTEVDLEFRDYFITPYSLSDYINRKIIFP